jgi:hypothetical protein
LVERRKRAVGCVLSRLLLDGRLFSKLHDECGPITDVEKVVGGRWGSPE